MIRVRKKRVIWSDTAVSTMINIFEEKKIMEHLDGSRYRNEDIFKMVANELNKQLISEYTVNEVRIKWKSLKKMFKEMQVKNNTSGHNKVTHKWYDCLSDLIGHRAISQPMANGVDLSFELNNDSVLETSTQTVIEEHLNEEDPPIVVMPDNDSTVDDALTPEQTGEIPKVSIRPLRTAPYKKSLKAFSKDIAEEAKQLQADFFVKQDQLMDKFFTKQKKWEEEVLEKEDAIALADRISNDNIMNNLMALLANQPQYPIQYPY